MHRRVSLVSVVALALLAGGLTVTARQGVSGSAGGRPPAAPVPAGGVPAPPPPTGTSAISGVISDGVTHQPVAGAVVYLGIENHGPAVRNSQALTDRRGRFVFQNLPASNLFFLSARKLGYSDGNYGADGTSGSATTSGRVALADGQWFGDANITLWKPGAIGGTVTDEHGEPVVGALVRAFVQLKLAGLDHVADSTAATTDDRGRYRLQALSPGTYIVTVPSVQTAVPLAATPAEIEGGPPNTSGDHRNNGALALDPSHLLIIGNYPTPPPVAGRPQAYPIAFYANGTSLANATPIVLGHGESRDAVDFTLKPVPTVRVSGRVEAPPEALHQLVLRLRAAGLEDLGEGTEAATSLVSPDGTFTFLNVPAGTYTIDGSESTLQFSYGATLPVSPSIPRTPGGRPESLALSTLPSGSAPMRVASRVPKGDTGFWGRLPLTVGAGDVTGVVVTLQRSRTLHGQFAFDGTGDAPPQPTVFAEPADGHTALGMPWSSRPAPGDEGTFTLAGLRPGEYVLRIVGLNPLYAVESIRFGSTDYATRPFDASAGSLDDVVVTLTDRLTTISGVVTSDQISPVLHTMVLMFPTSRDQWSRYGLFSARIKTVTVSSTGTFRTQAMPAGSYYLVALTVSDGQRWQDPAFLEAAAQVASTVTVGWGESRTQTLRLSTIK